MVGASRCPILISSRSESTSSLCSTEATCRAKSMCLTSSPSKIYRSAAEGNLSTVHDFPSPQLTMTRRDFFGRFALGLGGVALGQLFNAPARAAAAAVRRVASPYRGLPEFPNFAPCAKRIIYLFMSGGPSQMDLFDYKPKLNELNGQELPASVRMGQRLTTMSANQSSLPLAGSIFKFAQHGTCGAWVSELLPHTARVVDDLCFIKSLHTEAINHDPAITFFQTGSQLAGRPSMGAWLSYGLGSMNENL